MNGRTQARHAVYFAPAADHPLWAAGCAWLGRDARTLPATAPACEEVRTPWRYGWHATLKAPLRLRPGASEVAWLQAVGQLAARHAAFEMPPLRVAAMDGFLALVPTHPLDASHPLRRLADDCVQALDHWRAPMTPDEQRRHLRPGSSERQRRQLEQWGFARVLDDWRFHMTLTNDLGDVPAARVRQLRVAADLHFDAARRVPLQCGELCVFVEPAPGEPFELRHRAPLASA